MMRKPPLPSLIVAVVLTAGGASSAVAQTAGENGNVRPYSVRWVYEGIASMLAPAATPAPAGVMLIQAPAAPARPPVAAAAPAAPPPAAPPPPATAQAPAAPARPAAPVVATVPSAQAPAAPDDGGDLLDFAAKGVSDTVGALVSVFNVTNFNSPARQVGRMKASKGYDFWALVYDAGFELKEADTDVGLIPSFDFKFDKARELSDADRVWLERKLKRHARLNKGLAAKMKRAIVHALLEADDLNEGFSLEGFTVGFTPLPTLKFAVSPKDSRLLDKEHDWLYRAILSNRETTRRVGGVGRPAAETVGAGQR